MCELPVDAPVELHLLLCKALRDSLMTTEMAWRAWAFFNHLYFWHERLEGYRQAAIVSGGAGEANVVRGWVGMVQALLYQPRDAGFIGLFGDGAMYLETDSPNSRLNIAFAVRKLRGQGFKGKIRLHVYSSDYHTRALLELRYKLPEVSPFYFVEERDGILDVIEKPAPYLYLVCGVREVEWLAEAYLIRQGLRLVWENIRGISGYAGAEERRISEGERARLGLIVQPGTVGVFLEESFTRLEGALARFQKLLESPLNPRREFAQRMARSRQYVESFQSAVAPHMDWLKEHIGPVDLNELGEWKTRAQALEPFLNPSHVRDIDPDTPGFFWEQPLWPRIAAPEETQPAREAVG